MTYFVTGATGFIGRHLVARLLDRDADVYVLLRESSGEKLAAALEGWNAAQGGRDEAEDRIHPSRWPWRN